MKLRRIALIGLAGSFLFGTAAQGFVLTPKTDAQKHRRDISKQLAKYVFCLGKTAIKCEKKGSTAEVECDLSTGTTPPGYDAKASAKFVADIAKCDGKFLPAKKQKTSDYDQIGCPGDCDDGSDGIQRCTDLSAYEANVESGATAGGAKAQIGLLGAFIAGSCATFTGLPAGDAATIACAANDSGRLSKGAKGLNKCLELCENDYKVPNKKGGGGVTDAAVCNPDGSGDPNFNLCLSKKRDKQFAKILAPGNSGFVAGLVNSALSTASTDLYNKNDPAFPDPDVNVCGTCGDNTREGTEDCDGTDDSACVGTCNTDCTCP